MIPERRTYPSVPVWSGPASLPRQGLPDALYAWLADSSSLTRRLRAACSGRFGVTLLAQRRARPAMDEAKALRLRQGAWAMVRQVALTCDGRPCVFARTVIPLTTLRGPRRRLLFLRDRPLGDMLFRDPTMSRDRMEIACLQPHHRLFRQLRDLVPRDTRGVWGRRSLFRLGRQPLLVSEFFLPGSELWRHPPPMR